MGGGLWIAGKKLVMIFLRAIDSRLSVAAKTIKSASFKHITQGAGPLDKGYLSHRSESTHNCVGGNRNVP